MIASSNSGQPAFVIGVTGHLRLHADDLVRIEQELTLLLGRLQAPVGSTGIRNASGQVQSCDHPLLSQIPALGLTADSLVLLSSLAPGADQLAATVALRSGIRVMAPLPFPDQLADPALHQQYSAALYSSLNTFCWPDAPAARNAERQSAFAETLKRIRAEDRFVVRLPGDADLSTEKLAARLAADAADESLRNRRFRAAGEYIASCCDLLVAICNETERPCGSDGASGGVSSGDGPVKPLIPDDAECGASAIVQTRLFGTTPELLPDISALTWSDNGPMIRIWARNCRRGASADTAIAGSVPPPVLWLPESSRLLSPPGDPDPQHQQHEQRQLLLLAEQVTRLRRLPELGPNQPSPFAELTGSNPEQLGASGRLERLALLYERANSSSLAADRKVKRMQRCTPWFSLAGFLLLQCSDNLPLSDTAAWGVRLIPIAAMLLSLLLFAFPWIWRYWLRNTGLAAQQENDRALAEALRVQFYWALSGVGKSTAQYYQQRERGELSWIRAVVSSSVMPVSGFQDEFQQLDLPRRLQRLIAVRDGWLKTQQQYFRRTVVRQSLRLTKLHAIAQVLLWCGLSLLVSCSTPGRTFLERFLASDHPTLIRLLLSSIPVLLSGWLLLAWLSWLRNRSGQRQWPETLHRQAVELLTCYLVLIALGLWLACGMVTAISCVSVVPPLLAGTVSSFQLSLAFVCRNLCFAGSAILMAGITFHFLPQNVPRYQSMTELYRGAVFRMNALLERLGRQTSEADQQQAVRSLHALLEDLGSEALVENAEWLKMHRISPPSPLVPSP